MDPDQLRALIRQRLRPLAERHEVKIDLAPLFPSAPAFEEPASSELVHLAERLTGHYAEAVAFAPKRLIFSSSAARPWCSARATSPAPTSRTSTSTWRASSPACGCCAS